MGRDHDKHTPSGFQKKCPKESPEPDGTRQFYQNTLWACYILKTGHNCRKCQGVVSWKKKRCGLAKSNETKCQGGVSWNKKGVV
ncbi:hypothetical protein GDO81_021446 [Engystomops pustulosus]|uniref:Uncharacterized protein n=1 Tax=Engystomops pustulosus TaxID=76066 RepID=A0AAV6YQ84_ENGPU|nr:hypothetical protein GDO81_021446 [Engystomops pustulosus]